MKKIIFILALLISSLSISASPFSCGEYRAYGFVERIKKDVIFFVNKDTASEIKFYVDENLWPDFVPYFDSPAEIEFKILTPLTHYVGKISSIESIDRYLPNPVEGNSYNKLHLIRKIECKI